MIHIMMQTLGGPRLGITLLESIISPFIFIFVAKLINGVLKEENQIPIQLRGKISLKALIPTFLIVWPIRFTLDTFYTPPPSFSISDLNIPTLFFALMATIYFTFFQFFYKKSVPKLDFEKRGNDLRKFQKIVWIIITILWCVGFGSIFLYIFQKLGFFSDTSIKILYLGFFWALSTVIIISIVVFLINQILPIQNERPDTTGDKKNKFFSFSIGFLLLVDVILFIQDLISLDQAQTYIVIFTLVQILANSLIFIFQSKMYKGIAIPIFFIPINAIANFGFSIFLLSIGEFPHNWWNGVRFIILSMLLIASQINKRIPNEILVKTINISSIFSFGFWIVQLVFFQMIWRIMWNFIEGLPYFPQDLRLNILFAIVIYTIIFIFFFKRKILPQAAKESEERYQEALLKQGIKESDYNTSEQRKVILDVQDLKTYFYTEEGIVRAVEGVSFKIYQGQVLGLVGETGCGKSVTALSIMQLVRSPGRIEGGQVNFLGEDLLKKTKAEMRVYRGNKITMTFQDPLNSINPVYKIGNQISEVFLLHKYDELLRESAKKENDSIYNVARNWSIDLLREVEISDPENVYEMYPHELSGGMRQRVLIAMGLACSPELLIADEPTTALDVTIQNQILKLFKNLRKKHQSSMLFITHDLGIISKMCDTVAVMYSGYIVEYGNIKRLFKTPYHPYTKGLISSIPVVGKKRKRLEIIKGLVPNLIYPPSGCRFHERCDFCFKPCENIIPELIEVELGYFVACHIYNPIYSEMVENVFQKTEKINKNLEE